MKLAARFDAFVKSRTSTTSQKADLLDPYGYTIEDVRFIYSKASRETLVLNNLLRSILVDKFLSELETEVSTLMIEHNDAIISLKVETNSKILELQHKLLAQLDIPKE